MLCTPLVIKRMRTFTASSVGWRPVRLACSLFYPLYEMSLEEMKQQLLFSFMHGSTCTLLDVLAREGEGCAGGGGGAGVDNCVTTRALAQVVRHCTARSAAPVSCIIYPIVSAGLSIMCVAVPNIVVMLLQRRLWRKLMLLARWLFRSTVSPAARGARRRRCRRSQDVASGVDLEPLSWPLQSAPGLPGWFTEWPPRQWLCDVDFGHEHGGVEEAGFPCDIAVAASTTERLLRRWHPTILAAIRDEEECGGEELALLSAVRFFARVAGPEGSAHVATFRAEAHVGSGVRTEVEKRAQHSDSRCLVSLPKHP